MLVGMWHWWCRIICSYIGFLSRRWFRNVGGVWGGGVLPPNPVGEEVESMATHVAEFRREVRAHLETFREDNEIGVARCRPRSVWEVVVLDVGKTFVSFDVDGVFESDW